MDLFKACKQLITTDAFYGMFLLTLDKGYNNDIPTARVGLKGLNLRLEVNENWWNTLTNEEQKALLMHELLHICFGHIWMTEFADKERANIAMDLEVNQYITNHPPGGCILEQMFPTWPKKAGSIEYYNLLSQLPPTTNKELGFDDHSEFGKEDDANAVIKSQVNATIKEVAEQVIKMAGTVPGEIAGILQLLKDKPAIFNWKKYFRRVLGNSIITYIAKTRYKPSKRFEDSPGLKLKQLPNILVAVDTSGSISDRDLSEFFAEIYNISKSGVEITVIEFDTCIQNISKFKKNHQIEIHGRGSTDCLEVINYYRQHREFSSCVIFTDGYLCLDHLPKAMGLIWCITPGGNEQAYPGKTIYIPNYGTNS